MEAPDLSTCMISPVEMYNIALYSTSVYGKNKGTQLIVGRLMLKFAINTALPLVLAIACRVVKRFDILFQKIPKSIIQPREEFPGHLSIKEIMPLP